MSEDDCCVFSCGQTDCQCRERERERERGGANSSILPWLHNISCYLKLITAGIATVQFLAALHIWITTIPGPDVIKNHDQLS